jgi:hypothetical protein
VPSSEDWSGSVLAFVLGTSPYSREASERLRDHWVEDSAKVHGGPWSRFEAWATAWALPAASRDEAAEALARMPESRPTWTVQVPAALGHMYALLGRWDDAVRFLEGETRGCAVLHDVPSLVRAHVELGDAYAARGDAARACAEYAWVGARWGGAKPRSVTAEAAAKKAKALRCAPGVESAPRP